MIQQNSTTTLSTVYQRNTRLRQNKKMSQTTPRVLVVEDEKNVAEVVERYLVREGFETTAVHDGREALDMIVADGADLIILDIMLPGLDGLTVARKMRESGNNTPIIMLTARGQESDIVLGLGLGADDYMAKPFSPAELVARVHAVLRRAEGVAGPSGPPLTVGGIHISPQERAVTLDGKPVTLTQKEFDLLLFMARNPGTVFTREDLMERVWGYDVPGDTSTVTVHIRRVRSKVEKDPERPVHIKTVWGSGYRFDREQEA